MKKFFKNNLKTILVAGATAIICISGTVFATGYFAKDINYTREGSDVKNVAEALNDLYNNQRLFEYKIGANSKTSGIETIEIKHDNSNAILATGQRSLEYSINSTDSFNTVESLGYYSNGLGFHYAIISVKKGDTINIKIDTNNAYGYAFVY